MSRTLATAVGQWAQSGARFSLAISREKNANFQPHLRAQTRPEMGRFGQKSQNKASKRSN